MVAYHQYLKLRAEDLAEPVEYEIGVPESNHGPAFLRRDGIEMEDPEHQRTCIAFLARHIEMLQMTLEECDCGDETAP